MDINTIITKKRIGGPKGELTQDEIKYFVGKYAKGEILESQAAALMSYMYVNGLTEEEIIRFVIEIGNSGDVLDFSKISDKIVDKHSTGGVGDKITLILLPVMAALGLPVAKISSRGYGTSGGTIDKLESIPGFRTDISIDEFKENVSNIGMSIVSQDLNLAPVENKFYRLRNDISCKDSIVLIAISLMSLKVATGSNKLVFDLSCGKGSYLETREDARRLGKLLVRIGKALDKQVGYIITAMDEPVGNAVGNFLEIQETINALNGKMAKDVEDSVVMLASIALHFAYGEKDLNKNAARVLSVIKSGQALTKFKQMVMAQYGDVEFINSPDRFPKAKYILPVLASDSGYISQIDADMIGSLAIYIGAGRSKDYPLIDNNAGIVLAKKVGDKVEVGEIIAHIHANDEDKATNAAKNLSDAYKYSKKPISVKSKILEVHGI
jgi:pyrimidine-nucleoside phosphorylase